VLAVTVLGPWCTGVHLRGTLLGGGMACWSFCVHLCFSICSSSLSVVIGSRIVLHTAVSNKENISHCSKLTHTLKSVAWSQSNFINHSNTAYKQWWQGLPPSKSTSVWTGWHRLGRNSTTDKKGHLQCCHYHYPIDFHWWFHYCLDHTEIFFTLFKTGYNLCWRTRNVSSCIMLQLLVTANVVPRRTILVTLMVDVIDSSKTSVIRRATWHNIPEDSILHSHRCAHLKSYTICSAPPDVSSVEIDPVACTL
jgi:hypothetical protein